jgi:hypothetical protein
MSWTSANKVRTLDALRTALRSAGAIRPGGRILAATW